MRIDTKDKNTSITKDGAIANTYKDKFINPLDFEMLDRSIPYYQSGLRNQLCYEITFNDYGKVIVSTGASSDGSYKISDIFLEYEIVTQPDLARRVSDKYPKYGFVVLTEFSDTDKYE